jgi:hypothetical protein
MQRKSYLLSQDQTPYIKLEGKCADEGKQTCSSNACFYIGVIIYISAALPDVVAYALIPQVLCSTLQCLRMVLVAVMAHFLLNEHIKPSVAIGILLCTCGSCLCVVFGPARGEDTVSAEIFYDSKVVIYMLVGFSVLAGLLILEHLDDMLGWTLWSKSRGWTLPATAGLAYGLEKVFNTELGLVNSPHALFPLEWSPWIGMIFAVVGLGLLDLYLNLRGAQKLPVQVFAPIGAAFSTSVQYLQSVFIFDEFIGMSRLNMLLSLSGALMACVGMLFIKPPDFSQLCGGKTDNIVTE